MNSSTPTCQGCGRKFPGDPCSGCTLPAAVSAPEDVAEFYRVLRSAARGTGGSRHRRRRKHGRGICSRPS